MALEHLILWLWIEEDNMKNDGKVPIAGCAKANIVEHIKSSKNAKKNKKKLGPKWGVS